MHGRKEATEKLDLEVGYDVLVIGNEDDGAVEVAKMH